MGILTIAGGILLSVVILTVIAIVTVHVEEYLDIRAIRKNNELEYKKQQEAKAQRMKDYGF